MQYNVAVEEKSLKMVWNKLDAFGNIYLGKLLYPRTEDHFTAEPHRTQKYTNRKHRNMKIFRFVYFTESDSGTAGNFIEIRFRNSESMQITGHGGCP